eukprot:TRINITY_DN23369_c0_g1_i1.p1 TRINITY_DN23369_c0_g1~~TRINITY_DN23369_c0_g1_i1.p1  ORF type:complete len:463 (-),score=81.74 TRINITY_DN23369_c0_g1_i1:78-1334(-)
MVVASVVQLRNNTMRTFNVLAGDIFSTPQVDGQPLADGTIEVPPGFDSSVDGLVVPWEALTRQGLVLTEVGRDDMVRCIVGPKEEDDANNDWIQLHSATWEPLLPERWPIVGKRHILGAVGNSSDWQLSFRDARLNPKNDDATLAEVVHFERAVTAAPLNTVFLNVFDLASALSIPNAILCNTVFSTIGAFHAAVEVYGEEWSFYRTPSSDSCGVCRSIHPRQHPVHVYRQSVNMGETTLREWEVRYLIRGNLAQKWPGGEYDLLHRNCIHFCDELLLSLGVGPVPPWVRGLHETGASVLRITWPINMALGTGANVVAGACHAIIGDGASDENVGGGGGNNATTGSLSNPEKAAASARTAERRATVASKNAAAAAALAVGPADTNPCHGGSGSKHAFADPGQAPPGATFVVAEPFRPT